METFNTLSTLASMSAQSCRDTRNISPVMHGHKKKFKANISPSFSLKSKLSHGVVPYLTDTGGPKFCPQRCHHRNKAAARTKETAKKSLDLSV